jgi:hypothetical protein
MSVKRHAPALEHVAVVGRQQVDGHIEAHPVGRAARPAAVHPAQGQTAGVIDEIDAGGFERVRAQVPVGHLADFTHPQARGNGHALRADVAGDGNQRRQAVAATLSGGQAIGYFGTYTVDEGAKTTTYHIERSTFPQ